VASCLPSNFLADWGNATDTDHLPEPGTLPTVFQKTSTAGRLTEVFLFHSLARPCRAGEFAFDLGFQVACSLVPARIGFSSICLSLPSLLLSLCFSSLPSLLRSSRVPRGALLGRFPLTGEAESGGVALPAARVCTPVRIRWGFRPRRPRLRRLPPVARNEQTGGRRRR
jgi:hypothetical protein